MLIELFDGLYHGKTEQIFLNSDIWTNGNDTYDVISADIGLACGGVRPLPDQIYAIEYKHPATHFWELFFQGRMSLDDAFEFADGCKIKHPWSKIKTRRI